jgi:hypothetical protein
MAAIFTQMRGYPIGPSFYREKSRTERIRTRTTTSITNGRNMIDINPKPQI